MAEEDRRDLQTFIDELQRLLQDVASETRHPHLLSPDRREDLRTALGALRRRVAPFGWLMGLER